MNQKPTSFAGPWPASMTITIAGVLVALAGGMTLGVKVGAVLLAAMLGSAALVRLIRGARAPRAVVIRSIRFDVLLFSSLSVLISVLAVLAPRH